MYRMKNGWANRKLLALKNLGNINFEHIYTLEIHYENSATMLEFYSDIENVFEAIRNYHKTDLDFKYLAISRDIHIGSMERSD